MGTVELDDDADQENCADVLESVLPSSGETSATFNDAVFLLSLLLFLHAGIIAIVSKMPNKVKKIGFIQTEVSVIKIGV